MSEPFRPFGLTHALALATIAALTWLLIAYARGVDAERRSRLEKIIAAVNALMWVGSHLAHLIVSGFNLAVALPLHMCHLVSALVSVALVFPRRWMYALIYFWGIGLCSQALITPSLRDPILSVPFWTFWFEHGTLQAVAVYILIVRRYRPAWRDYGLACAFAAAYLAVVLPVDIALNAEYGFVGAPKPENPTILDFLGPWPQRIGVIVALVAGMMALMMIPWSLARRIKGARAASACLLVATLAGAVSVFTPAGIAHAQTYPVKPIRIIAPFAPGGATDILARLVAQRLTESLGQQAIVENRAGGGSVIGTELLAKAAPDGHTLLMTSTSTVTLPSLQRKLSYDTLRDFATVTQLVSSPNVLVVHPSLPVKSVRELITLARARPDQIAFGSGGNGTSTHLGGEILGLTAGVRMLHVPYKGAGPATVALLSGDVSWQLSAILSTMPHITARKLRPIAVSSTKRSPVLPDVPPVADTLAGFEASPWTGVSVPAGTPKEIIARLQQETAKGFNSPETRERLARDGNELVTSTPEEFDAFFRAQMVKWAKVIKDANIRVD